MQQYPSTSFAKSKNAGSKQNVPNNLNNTFTNQTMQMPHLYSIPRIPLQMPVVRSTSSQVLSHPQMFSNVNPNSGFRPRIRTQINTANVAMQSPVSYADVLTPLLQGMSQIPYNVSLMQPIPELTKPPSASENFEAITQKTFATKRKFEDEENTDEQKNKRLKDASNKKLHVFTGTVDRVIKWHRINTDIPSYYEVIASVISIQKGNISMQNVMLLRDKKGPILQVVHYLYDHINIENFYVGQMLRCVGRMIGPNMLHAFSIRTASVEEISALQRYYLISDHAVKRLSNE